MAEILNAANTDVNPIAEFIEFNLEMSRLAGQSNVAQTPEQLADTFRYFSTRAVETDAPVTPATSIYEDRLSFIPEETPAPARKYADILGELAIVSAPHKETVSGLTKHGTVSKKTVTIEADKTKTEDMFDELALKLAGSVRNPDGKIAVTTNKETGSTTDGIDNLLLMFNKKMGLDEDQLLELMYRTSDKRDELVAAEDIAAAADDDTTKTRVKTPRTKAEIFGDQVRNAKERLSKIYAKREKVAGKKADIKKILVDISRQEEKRLKEPDYLKTPTAMAVRQIATEKLVDKRGFDFAKLMSDMATKDTADLDKDQKEFLNEYDALIKSIEGPLKSPETKRAHTARIVRKGARNLHLVRKLRR